MFLCAVENKKEDATPPRNEDEVSGGAALQFRVTGLLCPSFKS